MSKPRRTARYIATVKAEAEAQILAAVNQALETLKAATGRMPDRVSVNMERDTQGDHSAHAVVIRLPKG